MSKLNILKRIIHSDFHKTTTKLEEKDCTPPMIIKINDEDGKHDYFVTKFDVRGREVFPFFSDVSGLKKICDYIIFFEYRSKLRIIISELKLGKDNNNANKQLSAAEEFVKFIINSAERIGEDISSKETKIYKVRFCYSTIKRKRNTKMTDPLKHIEDDIYEYNSDEMKFGYFKHS